MAISMLLVRSAQRQLFGARRLKPQFESLRIPHHQHWRGVSNARVVDFKLTAEQAAQALRASRNILQKVPELEAGAKPPRSALLPFYVFDTTATLRFTAVLGYDYWDTTYDMPTRSFKRVKKTRWEQVGQVHSIDHHYGDDRPDISSVYAAFEYGRPYVQAVKIPNAIKESTPFRAVRFANQNRELETFDMYRTFAFELITARAREELEAEAQNFLLATYGANRVANFQGELSVHNTKCVPLYLPAYIFENQKEGARAIVGGVTGKVGGEKVYSEQRVAWAAAGAMAAYHVLWHVADYGFHNVGQVINFGFLFSVWIASTFASMWARYQPRLLGAMKEQQRLAEKQYNRLHSTRAQTDDFTQESYDFHQRQRQAYEQARQRQYQDYQRQREQAWRSGAYGGYGYQQQGQQQRQQRPREPGASPGDPLRYYKILGVQPTATTDDIKKAFRKQAMQKHPDMVAADKKAEATNAFQTLTDAYQVLRDPKKRKQYDMGMI